MRKLVNMVRGGGGSRYMMFNDKLTHIIIGTPSESEKKEVRSVAALGVIHVVRTNWLEDCDRQRKEFPVLQKHIAFDLLLPKDSVQSIKGALTGSVGVQQGSSSVIHQNMPLDQSMRSKSTVIGSASSLGREKVGNSMSLDSCRVSRKGQRKMQHDTSDQNLPNVKSSTVFVGQRFQFSRAFPEDRRAEIIQWVNQGGGEMVDDCVQQSVHFTIECHGVRTRPVGALQTTYVSSHWVRSCLEDGCLLDVGGHILYSPLPCQIPLPGFQSFRFCVSQYEDKDRLLLRNLCFVLGAKFVEKLTKKVTHLLCKFRNGPKYEAACKWGIQSVKSEWIYECIKQNTVVSMVPFGPKEITTQDHEAGLCTVSQFPTQAARMISEDGQSQLARLHEDKGNTSGNNNSGGTRFDNLTQQATELSFLSKRARLSENDGHESFPSSGVHLDDPNPNLSSTGNNKLNDNREVSVVPDVVAAIEDLLEQTSKIHEQNSPGRSDKSLFSPDYSAIGHDKRDPHSVRGLSKHWLNRNLRKDDTSSPAGVVTATPHRYDEFSETQTDSQVVTYEEDLSGRQMLIDRIRTRNSLT